MTANRIIVWFSRGAASAVAAKMTLDAYPKDRVSVVYCNTAMSENADGDRFQAQISDWINFPITVIGSDKYESVDEVFERERYMSGIAGARCTVEMKKIPRMNFQRADDCHVFGYCVDEQKRIKDFKANNPELTLDWILRDNFIRKVDCYRILKEAGIELPEMYRLGFEHNNCLACVKATSPGYWNKTRVHFPEAFDRRARQSREIGCRLVRLDGERIFLDELPSDAGLNEPDGDIECGPYCTTPLDFGGV